jgi:hydrogenase nickel incorporation protein HypA/HybF
LRSRERRDPARSIAAEMWCRVRIAARVVHELALMESVVEAVLDRTGDREVAVVRLEIGVLAGVAIDAMRFCFDVCVKGTRLDGAELDVISLPGRARCRSCGGEHPMRSLIAACPCGSFDRELVSGDELRIKEVEVM